MENGWPPACSKMTTPPLRKVLPYPYPAVDESCTNIYGCAWVDFVLVRLRLREMPGNSLSPCAEMPPDLFHLEVSLTAGVQGSVELLVIPHAIDLISKVIVREALPTKADPYALLFV